MEAERPVGSVPRVTHPGERGQWFGLRSSSGVVRSDWIQNLL